MLTISVFFITIGLTLASVWWACRTEIAPQDRASSEVRPA
jgi:hypothetical protein